MEPVTEAASRRESFVLVPASDRKDSDMDDETQVGPRRLRRASLLAGAALAGTVLLTSCGFAGVGGDKAQAPNGQTDASRHEQAVAYSKCMRENGDPSWPDPNPDGSYNNENGSLDRESAAYKKAAAACTDLEVSGGPGAAQIEQAFTNLLKYSKCMRDNGVAEFPDPKKEDGGVGIELNGDIDEDSTEYKNALTACKSLEQG